MDNFQYSKKNDIDIGINTFRFANIFNLNSIDNIQRAVKTVKTESSLYLGCEYNTHYDYVV